jgi:integrase/recombinase XerD
MLIDLSRVRVSGQLSAFATGFADHMTRQGYSPHQTRVQLLLLNHLSNWLASEGLVVGELRAKEVERFQLSRYEAGYSFLRSIRAMQPILGYLRGLGIAPAASSPPASGVLEAALERYRGYLMVERGIRNESASRYIDLMRRRVHLATGQTKVGCEEHRRHHCCTSLWFVWDTRKKSSSRKNGQHLISSFWVGWHFLEQN